MQCIEKLQIFLNHFVIAIKTSYLLVTPNIDFLSIALRLFAHVYRLVITDNFNLPQQKLTQRINNTPSTITIYCHLVRKDQTLRVIEKLFNLLITHPDPNYFADSYQ